MSEIRVALPQSVQELLGACVEFGSRILWDVVIQHGTCNQFNSTVLPLGGAAFGNHVEATTGLCLPHTPSRRARDGESVCQVILEAVGQVGTRAGALLRQDQESRLSFRRRKAAD